MEETAGSHARLPAPKGQDRCEVPPRDRGRDACTPFPSSVLRPVCRLARGSPARRRSWPSNDELQDRHHRGLIGPTQTAGLLWHKSPKAIEDGHRDWPEGKNLSTLP